MSDSNLKPEEIAEDMHLKPCSKGWMDPKVDFNKGTFNYSGVPKNVEYLQIPNPRKWQPTEDDWQLPENWQEIILNGFKERLDKFRSLKIFMDICVFLQFIHEWGRSSKCRIAMRNYFYDLGYTSVVKVCLVKMNIFSRLLNLFKVKKLLA